MPKGITCSSILAHLGWGSRSYLLTVITMIKKEIIWNGGNFLHSQCLLSGNTHRKLTYTPDRTILVCFGDISESLDEAWFVFWRGAMEPKCPDETRLASYAAEAHQNSKIQVLTGRTQIRLSEHDIVAISGQWLDILGLFSLR